MLCRATTSCVSSHWRVVLISVVNVMRACVRRIDRYGGRCNVSTRSSFRLRPTMSTLEIRQQMLIRVAAAVAYEAYDLGILLSAFAWVTLRLMARVKEDVDTERDEVDDGDRAED